MTTVVSTMVLNSLVMLNDKTIGGTFTPTESAYYLQKLNTMLDSWGLESLLTYQVLQENFPLTASTAAYTIGSGGAFNTVWPNRIVKAFIRDSSNSDSPVRVLPSASYDSIIGKSVGNSQPTDLYYERSFPLGTIKIYPKPIAGLTLFLDSMKQLQSFSTFTDTLSLPPGYQRAIESNFCIELAPGLTTVSPEVVKIAKESKASLKGMNAQDSFLRFDAALTGKRAPSSIITGP